MRRPRFRARLFAPRETERLDDPTPAATHRFPSGFLFGAATAAHQAEGGDVHSDWWRYEREPGRVRGWHEFPERARTQKSDHWARFDEDVKLMRALGLGAYRFGIDWSRV